MNLEIEGKWYPAGSSARHKATLTTQWDKFELKAENGFTSSGFFDELEFSDRIGNIPTKVILADGSIFESPDNAALDNWMEKYSSLGSVALHKLESRWRWIIPSLIIVVALCFSGFKWGLPWASKILADNTPRQVVEKISSSTLSALDKLFFEESEILELRRQKLQARFEELIQFGGVKKSNKASFKLGFRKLGVANAFALPSGEIILSDKMIEVSGSQKQIDSVLLHEMGHVVNSHGLQQVIRSSIVSFVIAMIAGDPSGLEEIFVALPTFVMQNHYSRVRETEADIFALQIMMDNGIDPGHFTDALQKIDPTVKEVQNEPTSNDADNNQNSSSRNILDYLSSHPATQQRIAMACEYSKRFNEKSDE